MSVHLHAYSPIAAVSLPGSESLYSWRCNRIKHYWFLGGLSLYGVLYTETACVRSGDSTSTALIMRVLLGDVRRMPSTAPHTVARRPCSHGLTWTRRHFGSRYVCRRTLTPQTVGQSQTAGMIFVLSSKYCGSSTVYCCRICCLLLT